MTFKEKVYNVVKQIKKGKVLTYKQVAEKIGHPKSYRAVGNVLSKNTDVYKRQVDYFITHRSTEL